MKIHHWIVLAVSLLLFPAPSWAQTVVLVHGFQSNGMDWREQGVTVALQQQGWVDGGELILTPQGLYNPLNTSRVPKPERIVYTLELPSQAPIMQQAYWLDRYLQQIYAVRQEPLTLVGHSAGGLVARGWLVRYGSVPVDTLVTLATPHLGTPRANMASAANSTPMSLIADVLGLSEWTEEAQDIYHDMRTEEPGRFIYWLNHQPHPAIRYVSVVRDNQPMPNRFDFVVPSYSQNMNNTFMLHGKSEYWVGGKGHGLGVADGLLLAQILAR